MSIPINISGSRSSGILNLSQYETQVSIFLKIMGKEYCNENNYEYPEFNGNTATRFGSAFETAILKQTEKHYKSKITDREKFFENDFLTCHVDGIMDDYLIEAKTTTFMSYKSGWGVPGTDQIPVIYQTQVQHNLYLSELEKCILPVLIFPKMQTEFEEMGIGIDNDFSMIDIEKWVSVLYEMGFLQFYEIKSNPELQSLMIKHYTDFWNNHILTGTPPEARTYDDIKKLVREPVGTIVATPEIEDLMSEYKNIKSEISSSGELAKRADMIKVEILKYMSETGVVIDEDSQDKFILRDQSGKKIASYGKTKKGVYVFR